MRPGKKGVVSMKEELEELTDALWMIREREKTNRQTEEEKPEVGRVG